MDGLGGGWNGKIKQGGEEDQEGNMGEIAKMKGHLKSSMET